MNRQQVRAGTGGALVAPLRYLSSEAAGWTGLRAEAFHEPPELEGWVTPASPDVALILFDGGGMRLAQRSGQGSWSERRIVHGDLMLRPGADSPTEFRWSSLSDAPTRTLHIRLAREVLARAAEEVLGADPERIELAARPRLADPLLQHLALGLWRELERPDPGGRLYAEGAAQLLAVHLLRHHRLHRPAAGEPRQPRRLSERELGRVADFVAAHLDRDLALADLAAQVGLSPYHFARLFRASTGESPHQYVVRLRVGRAQHLLAEGDTPLAQVALACGFASHSHLAHAFRRQLGLTPQAFRRAAERT